MAIKAPTNKPGAQTHLQGRALGKQFRRSGLQFDGIPRFWSLDDLRKEWGREFDAKLRAVLEERQIAARLCSVDDLDEGARPGVEELTDENAALKVRLAELEARLAALEAPRG